MTTELEREKKQKPTSGTVKFGQFKFGERKFGETVETYERETKETATVTEED